MGLVELVCQSCGTKFFGVEGRDACCHICKIIVLFRIFFGLEDLDVDEIDFKRVREPNWEETDEASLDDWRNYIPQGLREMWLELPFEAKVMAIMFAEKTAREKFEEAYARG